MRLSNGADEVGNKSLPLALLLSGVLLVLTYLYFLPFQVAGDAGICLPSPNEWILPRFTGWLLNTLVLGVIVFLCAQLNRTHNFISTTDSSFVSLLLITLSCNPLCNFTLTTSTLLLAANVLSLYFLFDSFEKRNAAQQYFTIATFIAVGSLFQYAFLMMIPIYLIGGVLMKSLRLRELTAFFMGLIAPYWVLVGLGIISVDDFQLPETLTTIAGSRINNDLFASILMAGILALIAVILSLYNGVKLYSRNSKIRSIHFTFNIMGLCAVLSMLLDFNNFMAYFATLCLWFVLETVTLVTLYRVALARVWLGVLAACLIIAFIFIN